MTVQSHFWVIRLTLVAALCASGPVVAAPEKWKAEIDQFTAADAVQPPPAQAVLFIGSSSIRKWTSLARDFPGVPVINRGFGGSELGDSVFYADRIAIPYRPRLIVVYAGDNDLARGKTPGNVHADFRAFCAKIHAALPQTRILFVAIKPSPAREKLKDKILALNALIATAPRGQPVAGCDARGRLPSGSDGARATRNRLTPSGEGSFPVFSPMVAGIAFP